MIFSVYFIYIISITQITYYFIIPNRQFITVQTKSAQFSVLPTIVNKNSIAILLNYCYNIIIIMQGFYYSHLCLNANIFTYVTMTTMEVSKAY